MDENDVLKALEELEEQDSKNEDVVEDCEDDSDADPDYYPNPIEEANLEEAILVIENSVEKTKKRSKVNKPNVNEIPTIETRQNIPRFIEYKGCLNSIMSNLSSGGITDRDVTRRTLNFVYMP